MRKAIPAAILVLGLAPGARPEEFVVRPPAEKFKDVSDGHWAASAVDWLRREGMLEGWGRRFHGRRTFTRYEMAEILARYSQRLREASDRLAASPEALEASLGAPPAEVGEAVVRTKALAAEVDALEDAVEKVAAQVATHQVLLENPRSQPAWRRRVESLRSRPGAPSDPAPVGTGDGARSDGSLDRRRSSLLAALDALAPDEEPAGDVPRAAPAPEPTPRSPARERIDQLLRISRSLRDPQAASRPRPVLPGRLPVPAPMRLAARPDPISAPPASSPPPAPPMSRPDPERERVAAWLQRLALSLKGSATRSPAGVRPGARPGSR